MASRNAKGCGHYSGCRHRRPVETLGPSSRLRHDRLKRPQLIGRESCRDLSGCDSPTVLPTRDSPACVLPQPVDDRLHDLLAVALACRRDQLPPRRFPRPLDEVLGGLVQRDRDPRRGHGDAGACRSHSTAVTSGPAREFRRRMAGSALGARIPAGMCRFNSSWSLQLRRCDHRMRSGGTTERGEDLAQGCGGRRRRLVTVGARDDKGVSPCTPRRRDWHERPPSH